MSKAMHILAEETKNSSSLFYCIILGVYQSGLFLENVFFRDFSGMTLEIGISFILLILLGVYLESILVSAIRKRWVLVLTLILLTGFLVLCARMQRDKFDGLMIAILAVCAYGKDYRRILKVMLAVAVATVAIAMIGLPLGITVESQKDGLYGTGLAFGTVHPNVWGSYIFFIFVLVWYLFVKDKGKKLGISYLATSWVLAVFMVLVPKCRTQALLLLLFPLTIWLSKSVTRFSMVKERSFLHKSVLWILVLFPVLCFFLTILLGSQREWLAIHTMGTYIENFSKRFIQSGLAFREHGFPIFGELIRFQSGLAEELGGYEFSLYVLDNAYVTYTIYRGLIWMIPALLWLSFANWKMIKKRDYSLLTISILFCLMGLMERFTLGVYNFVFLYPLAISMLAKDATKEDSGQPSASREEAST